MLQLEVENIKCAGCMHSIKSALLKIPGVQNAEIELETEIVSISGDVNRELVVDTLAKLGYPEKGNNNLLHKAKSYVSCAIGKINQHEE